MAHRNMISDGASTDGNADVPSAQQEAEEQARVSRADGDEGRTQGSQPSAEARPEAARRIRRPEAIDRCTVAASGPESAGRRLPRERRISNSADIRAILKRGKRSGTALMDVFHSASPASHPRVGVVVPRYRHNIVERNRVKRRIREALRTEVLPRLDACGATIDVLVRARTGAYGAPFRALRDELIDWTENRCSGGRSS